MPHRLARATAKKRPIESKGAPLGRKRSKLLVIVANAKGPEDTDSGERMELDERTTQILEEELQAIMIKVWQTLPDNPPSAAERYVTEQLRNEASDDIRNVLGLNVTKRLLNVFNPLYLKLTFSSRPEPEQLQQFAKTQNIVEMRTKYSGGQVAYIVRVASIADFDRLCNARNLRCGNLTVIGKPYYRFNDLPLGLNTGFVKKIKLPSKSKQDEKQVAHKEVSQTSSNDKIVKQASSSSENKQQTVKSKQISRNDELPKKNESDIIKQSNVTPNKVSETKPNVVKTTQNVQKTTTPSNVPKPKPTQVTNENTTVKKVNIEKTPTPTSVSKPKPNQDNQEVVATKKVTEATKTAMNLTQAKPNQANKESVATKKVTEATPKLVGKTTVTTNQGVATKKLEPTPKAVKHTEKPNVTQPKQNQVNKVVATKKENQVNKEIVATKKENQVNKEVVATKKVTDSKPKLAIKNVEMINAETFDQEGEMDEDDEMDDEEILALISTGVIVDECSGSDEE